MTALPSETNPAVDGPRGDCHAQPTIVRVVALRHFSRFRGQQGEQHYSGEEFQIPEDRARQWAAEGLVRVV